VPVGYCGAGAHSHWVWRWLHPWLWGCFLAQVSAAQGFPYPPPQQPQMSQSSLRYIVGLPGAEGGTWCLSPKHTWDWFGSLPH